MSHLSEEDLVFHHYGEHDEAARVEDHLRSCLDCRAAAEALRVDLAKIELPSPARGPDYGERVWAALAPRLEEPTRRQVTRRPFAGRAASFLAIAAGLVLAFALGRILPRPGEARRAAATRERILLVAVGRHLERSQRVLVELSHADAEEPVDVSAQAAHLVAENRLYRQTAERAGEAGLASVLDELERVFVEAANSGSLTPDEVRNLNERIERKGLLFKVRVLDSQLRARQREIEGGEKSSL